MRVTVEYNKILSYVTYLNRTPIIQNLTLWNDGTERQENMEVKITWDSPVAEPWWQPEITLEAGQSQRLNFERNPIKLIGKEFAAMTEGYQTGFQVMVCQADQILFDERFEVDVLAYDHWLGINYYPALIASFVTPNHPAIARIIDRAGQILNGWGLSFTGYQTQDKNDVRAQMKAIYLALEAEQIKYVPAPPSFEASGQRLRMVEEVLTNKLANCIEMALLYAACLEYVGLNPLILILNGHAFAGGWLEDMTFQASIDDDISALTKRLAKGIQSVELVETTLLTGVPVASYENAVSRAEEQIVHGHSFEYLLDITKARSLGVRPLPQKADMLNGLEGKSLAAEPEIGQAAMPESIENSDDIEIITSRKRSRLKVWESKLLNLTLRNNLLNFRPTRRSISILEGDLNVLEDYLSSGKEFSLIPCPSEIEAEKRKEKEYSYTRSLKDEYREYMNMEMKSQRLVTLMREEDLDFAIKALYYEARTELEENGANTLFVAMGFLKWFETELSKQPRFAPILLYPIDLIRKSSAKGYVIRFRDEEVQVNTTLLEKMRMELNLEFPGLVPLPLDENGVDIKKVLNTIRTAVIDKKGWDVIDVSYIGLFSFHQFVMWNDIHSRSEELMENPIVGSLMQGKMAYQTPPILDSSEVDNPDLFFHNAVLMDADSSQLTAVYSASKGSSFVLHGPPGTGKSQTITNIIASALYNNKSVLFVAEKMAALNVVQSRLEKIGIGDFALELHSNKTKKGEVLAKINRILDKKKNGQIKEIQEKRESLHKIAEEIRTCNASLHRIRESGYSVYDMIALHEKQETDEHFPVGQLAAGLSKMQVEQIENAIERLLPLHKEVEPVGINALSFIQNANLSFKEREELRTQIIELRQSLNHLSGLQKEFAMVVAEGIGIEGLKYFADLLYHMTGSEDLLWYYLIHYGSEEASELTLAMFAKGRREQQIYQQICQDFGQGIFTVDAKILLGMWKEAEQKWFLSKMLKENSLLKSIRSHAVNPAAITRENAGEKLELLVEWKGLEEEVASFMNRNAEHYGNLWQGRNTDWNRLEQAFLSTMEAVRLLRLLRQADKGINIPAWLENAKTDWLMYRREKREIAVQLHEHCNRAADVMKRIQELAGAAISTESHGIESLQKKAERVINEYAGLDSWMAYIAIRSQLYQLGVQDFIGKMENGEIQPQELKKIIIKSLMYYGIIEIMEQEKELAGFHRNNFEYLLEQYRKELRIVTEMTRLELIEKLVAGIPQPLGDININSELGLLKKAIKSNGRGVSLRKLFDMAPNVLRKIAPCMLMSPISIAQYIDPAFPKFDLVIFDEASQVNTHSAVGAIARGNQLIVVGDPNQLPPTSFFKGNFDEEEIEFEEADQESILDECQSIMFPELHLKWHYRSKHESLIAFSNSQYYENKLYTFPSYNDLESKVKLIEVEGFYDRSGSKHNLAEAEAIIEEVKQRLLSPDDRKRSLGIVTFSSVQQKLIQTKLDEMFASYPQLEEYSQELSEEIFVKNLENVQGDERDVILFSVGYGPDKEGKVTMNFGPLNHSEGWKRLNVVVSRSREEMMVFSTLKPEQIDLSRTDSLGVAGLKRFLEFARNKNSLSVDVQNVQLRKDELIDAIASKLEKEGYSVVRQVGKSNYRIDIGVVDSENPNQFMAAIIVDGYQYHGTPTVRDKTVVQPFMLKRLQWNVISVWALEWFKNKRAVMDMIKTRLQQIKEQKQSAEQEKKAKAEGSAGKEEFVIEYVEPVKRELVYYEEFPLQENLYAKEDFYRPETMPRIVQLMKEIIAFESPVVEEDLFRRILSVWGINQIGSKLSEILKEAAEHTGSFYLLDDAQNTYWRSREEYEKGPTARRCKEVKRKFAYISEDEIAATILEILTEQVSLDFKNLCKEVFKFHGYNMLGEEAQNTVYQAVYYLIHKNQVLEEEGRYLKR